MSETNHSDQNDTSKDHTDAQNQTKDLPDHQRWSIAVIKCCFSKRKRIVIIIVFSSSTEETSIQLSLSGTNPRDNQNLSEMQKQINFLASVVFLKKQPISNENTLNNDNNFLSKPTEKKSLDLGTPTTLVDEKRVIRLADPDRLITISNLQRFGRPEWKEVRYSSVLKGCLASPGFTELKVNDELWLCHIEKKNDYTVPTERVLAGLGSY